MPISSVKTYGGHDYPGRRDQQDTREALDQVTGNALIGGALAKYTAPSAIPAATDFIVNHGLGRTLTGNPIACLSTLAGTIYLSPTVNTKATTQVILQSTVKVPSGTVLTLYVY